MDKTSSGLEAHPICGVSVWEAVKLLGVYKLSGPSVIRNKFLLSRYVGFSGDLGPQFPVNF